MTSPVLMMLLVVAMPVVNEPEVNAPVTPKVPPTVELPVAVKVPVLTSPVLMMLLVVATPVTSRVPAFNKPGTVKLLPVLGPEVLPPPKLTVIGSTPIVTPCAKAPPETKATTARAIKFFFIENSVNKNDIKQFVAVTSNEYL